MKCTPWCFFLEQKFKISIYSFLKWEGANPIEVFKPSWLPKKTSFLTSRWDCCYTNRWNNYWTYRYTNNCCTDNCWTHRSIGRYTNNGCNVNCWTQRSIGRCTNNCCTANCWTDRLNVRRKKKSNSEKLLHFDLTECDTKMTSSHTASLNLHLHHAAVTLLHLQIKASVCPSLVLIE